MAYDERAPHDHRAASLSVGQDRPRLREDPLDASLAESRFQQSGEAGATAAAFYTLTMTCNRHNIDVQAYLLDVFRRIRTATPDELESLLPDRWIQDHPEARVVQRVQESHAAAARKRQRRARRPSAVPSGYQIHFYQPHSSGPALRIALDIQFKHDLATANPTCAGCNDHSNLTIYAIRYHNYYAGVC
jgi:hypothetical protein